MALGNGQSTASVYGSATGSPGHGNARSASSDITHTEKHDFIQGEIYAKRQWLEKFGSGYAKWPDHIIEQKQ